MTVLLLVASGAGAVSLQASPGGVRVEIPDKLCNVMAYGGHGNGRMSDSDAIMRAFRDCGEGGRILLPGTGWKAKQGGGFLAHSMVRHTSPYISPVRKQPSLASHRVSSCQSIDAHSHCGHGGNDGNFFLVHRRTRGERDRPVRSSLTQVIGALCPYHLSSRHTR
jgi:hypothetical protein